MQVMVEPFWTVLISPYLYDSPAEVYQFPSSKTIAALLGKKQGDVFVTCILNEGKLASDILKFHLFQFAISESRDSVS